MRRVAERPGAARVVAARFPRYSAPSRLLTSPVVPLLVPMPPKPGRAYGR